MCYAKCQEAYGRLQRKRVPTKNDRRNFMALVRTTYLRHITDLANERTATPERTISQMHRADETASDWMERHGPTDSSLGDLAVLLTQAPEEIRNLIEALTGDATEALKYQRHMLSGKKCKSPMLKGKLCVRETTQQYLCRLAKMPRKKNRKTVDMRERLLQYFQIEPTSTMRPAL
jgi:hypothetical protein